MVAPKAVESSLERIMGVAPILTIGFKNEGTDFKHFEALKDLVMSKGHD